MRTADCHFRAQDQRGSQQSSTNCVTLATRLGTPPGDCEHSSDRGMPNATWGGGGGGGGGVKVITVETKGKYVDLTHHKTEVQEKHCIWQCAIPKW